MRGSAAAQKTAQDLSKDAQAPEPGALQKQLGLPRPFVDVESFAQDEREEAPCVSKPFRRHPKIGPNRAKKKVVSASRQW